MKVWLIALIVDRKDSTIQVLSISDLSIGLSIGTVDKEHNVFIFFKLF